MGRLYSQNAKLDLAEVIQFVEPIFEFWKSCSQNALAFLKMRLRYFLKKIVCSEFSVNNNGRKKTLFKLKSDEGC